MPVKIFRQGNGTRSYTRTPAQSRRPPAPIYIIHGDFNIFDHSTHITYKDSNNVVKKTVINSGDKNSKDIQKEDPIAHCLTAVGHETHSDRSSPPNVQKGDHQSKPSTVSASGAPKENHLTHVEAEAQTELLGLKLDTSELFNILKAQSDDVAGEGVEVRIVKTGERK